MPGKPGEGNLNWEHHDFIYANGTCELPGASGAGVPGGSVVAASDADGGYVTTQPFTFEDYASTICEKLGINRDVPLYTPTNCPVYYGHFGEPIAALFGGATS